MIKNITILSKNNEFQGMIKMINYTERSFSRSNQNEKCCENQYVGPRNGSLVCLNCGMVYGIQLVQKEKRAFTSDEIKERKKSKNQLAYSS